jgi:hypothetical protein
MRATFGVAGLICLMSSRVEAIAASFVAFLSDREWLSRLVLAGDGLRMIGRLSFALFAKVIIRAHCPQVQLAQEGRRSLDS